MPKLKMYVVDDDQDDRFFLTDAIKTVIRPVDIIELTDGMEFIQAIKEDAIESHSIVVLLDMNMPKMNGLEVLEVLQFDQKTKDIPVMMVSTSQNETLITEAYRLGVRRYFTKPFNMADYQKMVQQIMETLVNDLL